MKNQNGNTTTTNTRAIHQLPIVKMNGQRPQNQADVLAVEEPLEIRLRYGNGTTEEQAQKSIAITMRTPGNDFDLAIGFLFTESIIANKEEVTNIYYCEKACQKNETNNIVIVHLAPNVAINFERLERHFYTSSSCGVCGKASIKAAMMTDLPSLAPNRPVFAAELIHQLPKTLRQTQAVFEHTGGLHAAALFNTNGKLLLMREDVGRHNAVDKLIGATLQKGLFPLGNYLILVSGRASFELIQKSLVAGIPILAAVGAPSSLAIELAQSAGMTVLGFVRNQRYNIYCGEERIVI